jgi:hypothetical protein
MLTLFVTTFKGQHPQKAFFVTLQIRKVFWNSNAMSDKSNCLLLLSILPTAMILGGKVLKKYTSWFVQKFTMGYYKK